MTVLDRDETIRPDSSVETLATLKPSFEALGREINAKFAEEMSPDQMEKVLEEQARVQDAIEAAGAWDLDSKLEHAMDALVRVPPRLAVVGGGRLLHEEPAPTARSVREG